ncbi:MAG TPA: amino acid permease [Opitutaceae bacterium]|jgi:APA family basic amino acid/polyamine antiporter|nr:amino acid permease [Opitutaceae bacterium]
MSAQTQAPPAAAELPRKLGLLDATSLLVGAVIGSGIFVVPAIIARRIPEPGLVIAIWLFSGALVLCGALALAELGAMLPHSGGLYVYIREAYGPFWGFLHGWTSLLVTMTAPIAALTAAFLLYLKYFLSMPLWVEKPLGIVLILCFAWINSRGVLWGAWVQNLFTFLKVAGLVALVGLAIAWHPDAAAGVSLVGRFHPFWPSHFSAGLLSGVGAAMISTLFAYEGWHFVGFAAGEIKNPQRNVPYGIFLGVLVVIAVYIAANVAYIYVLGQDGVAASGRVASDAMTVMIGPLGAVLITLAILFSTSGAINSNVLAGPRIVFAMARDRVFFPWAAAVHPRYETPSRAIWMVGAWAAVLTLTGGYEHLITMAEFANWFLYVLAIGSVIILRRKHPEWPRPYRVPGYPWTALAFVIVAAAFVVNTLFDSPRSSLLGLGLVLAGVPIYARFQRTGRETAP